MYQKEFFTLGQGATFSSLSQLEFMKELGNRGIEWNFSIEDLHEGLKNLESLRKDWLEVIPIQAISTIQNLVSFPTIHEQIPQL